MLRRFQEFQWGPLNATRLNELVDAITRLQQQAAQVTPTTERGKDMILARIDGDGYTLKSGGRNVPSVGYNFTEVGLAITPDGDTNGASEVQYENIPGGVSTAGGAVLLAFEESPTMQDGEVVIAHYAPMIVAHSDRARKTVYMVKTMPRPSVDLYTVTGEATGLGRYSVVRANATDATEEEIENIYETSGYYGALDEPQNECAALEPRKLRVGDTVWGFRISAFLYTCAPTAFSVACQDCGTNPGGALASTFDERSSEILASELMLRG
jgi:hypothetical protein